MGSFSCVLVLFAHFLVKTAVSSPREQSLQLIPLFYMFFDSTVLYEKRSVHFLLAVSSTFSKMRSQVPKKVGLLVGPVATHAPRSEGMDFPISGCPFINVGGQGGLKH